MSDALIQSCDSHQIECVFIWICSVYTYRLLCLLQNEALNKMKALNDFVKSGCQKATRIQTTEDMKVCIKQDTYLEALSDVVSPLNPSIMLCELWYIVNINLLFSINMLHVNVKSLQWIYNITWYNTVI